MKLPGVRILVLSLSSFFFKLLKFLKLLKLRYKDNVISPEILKIKFDWAYTRILAHSLLGWFGIVRMNISWEMRIIWPHTLESWGFFEFFFVIKLVLIPSHLSSNLFPLIYFHPWGIFFFFFQERKRIKINHTIRQQKKKNHLTTIVIAYSVLLSSPYPYSIKIKNPIL